MALQHDLRLQGSVLYPSYPQPPLFFSDSLFPTATPPMHACPFSNYEDLPNPCFLFFSSISTFTMTEGRRLFQRQEPLFSNPTDKDKDKKERDRKRELQSKSKENERTNYISKLSDFCLTWLTSAKRTSPPYRLALCKFSSAQHYSPTTPTRPTRTSSPTSQFLTPRVSTLKKEKNQEKKKTRDWKNEKTARRRFKAFKLE